MIRSRFQLTLSGRFVILTGAGIFVSVAVLGALALLERIGLPDLFIKMMFLTCILAVFVAAGLAGRTMNLAAFSEGDRRIPADVTGLAAATDWVAGVALVSLLGGLALAGRSGTAWLVGWAGGLILILTLLAPSLRRSNAASVSDYLARRYGGWSLRLAALIVLIASAGLLLVAEITVVGRLGQAFFELTVDQAVWLCLGALALCAGLGGLRAVVHSNALIYVIMLLALVLPAALLALGLAGTSISHFALAEALTNVRLQEETSLDWLNALGLVVVVTTGMAAMPHMLNRYLAVASVEAVRQAVTWSLFFVAVLTVFIPVFAALALWQLQEMVATGDPIALPDWVFDYGGMGLIRICGAEATSPAVLAAACLTDGASQPWFDPGIVAIAAPMAAGLPIVIAGLVATGLLAATLTTANGLLLALANAVGNDLFHGLLGQKSSAGRRLLVARLALIAAAGGGAWAAERLSVAPLSLLAWCFNLAAAGLFPVLALGIWWSSAGRIGALAAMFVGFGLTLFYIVQTEFYGMAEWHLFGLSDGVANHAAAIFGLPPAFVVFVAVSLSVERRFTASPGQHHAIGQKAAS